MAVQSVGSDMVVMILFLELTRMLFLATWVRQGQFRRGKTHVADTWLCLQIIILFLINCYKFLLSELLKSLDTNVFNQYVDPFQVSDILVDPLPEYSDVAT